MRRSCAAPALLVALALAAACGPPRQMRYEEEVAAAPPPARHAVESQRLRDAMRRLEALRAQRLPVEMDVEARRSARAEAVAAAAGDMAAAADWIPDALEGVEMAEPARRVFLGLAAELGERSRVLARQAPGLTPEDLEAGLHDVDAVCAECHSRFRVLPRAP